MIKGEYRFYEQGELIGVHQNTITTVGKQQILRILCGLSGVFGESFAFGTGSTASAVGDTNLEFETTRANVDLRSPDYVNGRVTFKGSLPATFAGGIYEVGMWTAPEQNNSPGVSRMVLSFDPVFETYSAGSYATTNARFGAEALLISATASQTVAASLLNLLLDFSVYSNNDIFKLAYYKRDNNVSSIRIRFKTDASNYYTVTLSGLAAGTGYRISSFTKANAVATGTPNWTNIVEIEVAVIAGAGGTAAIDFDGLRVNDLDSFTGQMMLISRSVLSSPITKSAGLPLDVEYSLKVV
jgi:hypothetical protein